MIRVIEKENDVFSVEMSFRSPAIYLDHCAVREISKTPVLKERFLRAFHNKKCTLCFSTLNMIELGRNMEDSLTLAGDFLKEIGQEWFLVDTDAVRVIEKEERSDPQLPPPPFDEVQLRSFYPQIHGEPLSLAKATELVQGEKSRYDKIYDGFTEIANRLNHFREALKNRDPSVNQDMYPINDFNPARPTTYVYHRLMRKSLHGDKILNRNDVCDLMHATAAIAYADFVLLDKHWCDLARNNLKKIPGIETKIFKISEMDVFLDRMERIRLADVA